MSILFYPPPRWGGAPCLDFHTQQQEGQAADLLPHLDQGHQPKTEKEGGTGGAGEESLRCYFLGGADFSSLVKKGSIKTDAPYQERVTSLVVFHFHYWSQFFFYPPYSVLFPTTWIHWTESAHSGNVSKAIYHLLGGYGWWALTLVCSLLCDKYGADTVDSIYRP